MSTCTKCATPDRVVVHVTPAAIGRQLVRFSVPLPPGYLTEGMGLRPHCGGSGSPAAVRVLTWHPATSTMPRSARRALVTFPFTFPDGATRSFCLERTADEDSVIGARRPDVAFTDGAVAIQWPSGDVLRLQLIAPACDRGAPVAHQIVEDNACFRWQRWEIRDQRWPRRIEVRSDCLGGVAVVVHLQRTEPGDGWMPALGWSLEAEALEAWLVVGGEQPVGREPIVHAFADGQPCCLRISGESDLTVMHPAAPFKRRGVVMASLQDGHLAYQYVRGREADRIPMQERAWRRAEIVIVPEGIAPLTASLQSPHVWCVDTALWDAVYDTGQPLSLSGALQEALAAHHDGIVRSAAVGDDWGNVTSFRDDAPNGTVMGMNRPNHCPPIFEEGYRSGDDRLIETAVRWCDNFYDLSIWWGDPDYGGTRYNNIVAMNRVPLDDDRHYMWRSNGAVDFCTKGFDAFFLAYEQTGDPRMLEALEAQVAYAQASVHADTARGTTRNVGVARDMARLYRYTGEQHYLDHGFRLFRELQAKLNTDFLFAESGRPLAPETPFIEQDATGIRFPYAKPYILGYALESLPFLVPYAPADVALAQVIRAVADYVASSQDPLGGWRYPHPRSSYIIMSQAIEHAWQLMLASRALGEPLRYLDEIERVLRQRILVLQYTGKIYSGHIGWEKATGLVTDSDALEALYPHPGSRDQSRDYAEGRTELGSSAPDGLVYFPQVLRFYMGQRDPERLYVPPAPDEPLGQVLRSWHGHRAGA